VNDHQDKMKARLCFCSLLLLVLSVSGPSASADDNTINAKIDAYLSPYLAMNDFSGAILIAKNDQVIFRKSYGFANREWQTKIGANTKFRIGSISKQFTAAAVVLLEERKLLHLNDSIDRFIPGFPRGSEITLQLLLTHMSGLARDLPNKVEFSESAHSVRELVDIAKKLPLDSTPGTNYQYSNLEYLVLADVIEIVSGKDYATFLTENIFKPLQMTDTGVDEHDAILEERASGYQTGFGTGLINAQFEDMSNEIGYGSIYSTCDDLLKWQRAWNTDQVLRRSSWAKIFTDYGHGYGFGVSLGKIAGHKALGHDGSVAGFNAFLESFPEDHICIIYTGNIESGALLKLPDGLAEIALGEKYEIPALRPAAIRLTVAQIAPYAGTYDLFPGFSLEVVVKNGMLYLNGGGSDFFALTSFSENHFFYRHLYGDITFVRDSSRKVIELIWRWGGSDGKEYHYPKRS
jgi:CubicO group peptidase (beta-lactamase class C family)